METGSRYQMNLRQLILIAVNLIRWQTFIRFDGTRMSRHFSKTKSFAQFIDWILLWDLLLLLHHFNGFIKGSIFHFILPEAKIRFSLFFFSRSPTMGHHIFQQTKHVENAIAPGTEEWCFFFISSFLRTRTRHRIAHTHILFRATERVGNFVEVY